MSDFVVHRDQRAVGAFARHYDADVMEVHFEPRERTAIVLADGRAGGGTCLGCGSAPCIEKDDSELGLFGELDTFPGDPSRDVCPTRAIRWDVEKSVAAVVADSCIGCGLGHRPPLWFREVGLRVNLFVPAARHSAGNLKKVKQNRSHGGANQTGLYRLIDL